MDNCIFCKIVEGEIPAAKVYEDEHVLAFLDITQVTPGHTLLIPKKHSSKILEMDADTASQVFSRLPKLAQQLVTATGAKGMNIVNNTNEVAGQTVFHTHIHLLPRFSSEDDLEIQFAVHEPDFQELDRLAQTIRKAENVNEN